jgi:hypothetical protein
MSAIGCPFTNTRDAVTRLQKAATGPFLSTLPFNRFDKIDETQWWLSPSSVNPAYKYGKIICMYGNYAPEMFIGFYVEKGLDSGIAGPGFSGAERRVRMDSSWLWNDFVSALGAGDIDSVVTGIEAEIGRPVVVAFDSAIDGEPEDFVLFEFSQGRLTYRPNATAASAGRLLPLTSAATLRVLPQLFQQIADQGWLWINAQVGFAFSREGEETWDAARIWSTICAPWRPWLRAA